MKVLDAAATPHGVDRYMELISPTWSTREVRGRVIGVRRQTPGTVTLVIQPNRLWPGFAAGQYTQVTVEIDGVRHTRCYSMATPGSPSSKSRCFELTVKAHPGGVVSNYLVEHAWPGLVLGLTPAQGEFTIPAARPERILLVSGGSGITPVMSMLRTLCAEGHRGPVTFVHYCPTAADLTYRELLASTESDHPHVRVIRVFTDEPGAGDRDGFASVAQLDTIDPQWRSAETYVCGPAPLMDAMQKIYDCDGIGAQLHTEAFTLTTWAAEAGTASGTLHFGSSDISVESDGRTVLEQAEGAGLRPVSGCRMGICRTCTCPLVSGAVRNVLTGEVTNGDGSDVQICINLPVGDIEIDL